MIVKIHDEEGRVVGEKNIPEPVLPPDKPPVILEGWWWCQMFPGCLMGTLFNHPRLPDGYMARTSTVIWLREDLGLAQTRNTLYVLRHKAKEPLL